MRRPLTALRNSLRWGGAALLASKLTAAQSLPSADAAGEPRFSVSLETDERAASCPDQAWFEGRIASHSGQAGHAGRYRIVLSRRAEVWHARIQRLESGRGFLGIAAIANVDELFVAPPLAPAHSCIIVTLLTAR